MKTLAEQFEEVMGDGDNFESEYGDFEQTAEHFGCRIFERFGGGTRIVFDDESVVVGLESGWFFGYTDEEIDEIIKEQKTVEELRYWSKTVGL